MKAVILVGGQATRLLPLTCNTPKAMVPVLNIPFLEYVIRYLSGHQIKDIILAQGYLAQPIEDYLGDGSQLGVKLNYVVEDTPLGTAGAVKNAERYLDETFLMLNGDIFTDLDITAMIERHLERKAKATIALTPVDDPTSYGLIATDAQGRITRFLEKPSWSQITTNMINAGTYVLEPEILAQIPPQTKVSIEREVFPLLLEQGKPVYAYPSSAYWIDMGTPEQCLRLHRDLLSGKSSQYAPALPGEVVIGGQSYIHPTAQIKGPVMIGDNCTIGRNARLTGPVVIGSGCQILSEAVIEESIVWRNAQIGQHVNLIGSIVADNCCLNADSTIEDSILGDNVTVASGCKLEPGSQIWPGTTVEPKT
ncbi:UTP--glucose-1-phosphate uridylyltransferase [subsurface metagenome]